MHKVIVLILTLVLLTVAASPAGAQGEPNDSACWGQATKAFVELYHMGEHASSEPTPRLGLRNLARVLFEAGALPDDSIQALGVFVVSALGLEVAACGS